MMGIYSIKVGDKFYVGASKDLEKRIKSHAQSLEKGNHTVSLMQDDYNKIGIASIKVLKVVYREQYLYDLENYYIGKYNAIDYGYNTFLSKNYRFNEKEFNPNEILTLKKEV